MAPVIDAHAHLFGDEIPSPMWKDALINIGASFSGLPEHVVEEKIEEGQLDMSGDLLIDDMDAAGIDRTILNILDWGLIDTDGTAATLDEQHEAHAAAVDTYPDRLDCIMGIDPRRPKAAEYVDKALDRWEMVGVKLHPCSGFYPDDGCAYPIYERCLDHDVPVMIHTGPEIAPFRSKFGRPAHVDEVANRYPELDIIMAHVGLCWWEEGAEIASVNPNVMVDLGYWQSRMIRRPHDRFYRQLRYIFDMAGVENVFFGSDWPAFRMVVGQDEWVEAFESMPDRDDIEFDQDEIDAVLGGNADRLFY